MISLILASWNRTAEPEKLLQTLDDQVYRDFEVIVADQNEDDRWGLLLRGHPDLKVKHLRLERGLSRARNAALAIVGGAYCSGKQSVMHSTWTLVRHA